MKEPIDHSASRRVLWICRVALIWALVIAGRLVHLQVIKHEDFVAAARSQHHRAFITPPDRGEITDRTGHPLALSIRTRTAAINPQLVRNPTFFAGLVAPILDLEASALAQRIERMQNRPNVRNSGRSFLELKRHITADEERRLRQTPFKFIEILRDAKREYPNGPTAAHIIGSVDRFNTGNYGIEQKLDKELKGAPGKLRALTDSLRSRYFSWYERPTSQGVDLTLTIHSVVQHETEMALEAGVNASGAAYGAAIVMEPETGEILALANYPTFDPAEVITDRAKERAALARRLNYAVQAPSEPGSVMKMITVSTGLDTGRFTTESTIYCENGAFPRPGRRPIRDLGRIGLVPLPLILIKSSNIGVAKISLSLGPDTMWTYLKKFGLGERTGIELPSESSGMFKPRFCLDADGKPSRIIDERKCWGPASHEYIAFGHEIGATALQLARATAIIANGGYLVQPRLVLAKTRPLPGGRTEPVPILLRHPERVIKPETAFTVRRIMQQVVLEGTGRRARLAGYTAGGKTGSAEVWEGRVKRTDLNNASFIGFAPVTKPRAVVIVMLGRTPMKGGVAAAPIFKRITEATLRVLQVPPDELETAPRIETALTEPDLENLPEAAPLLDVTEAQPDPDQEAVFSPLLDGPRVPDLLGKPVVSVMQECARRGLDVEIIGRGRARSQQPRAGAILPPGAKVLVEFRP
jgi:cell division protein FtsI (penicillin-binding protein 3)